MHQYLTLINWGAKCGETVAGRCKRLACAATCIIPRRYGSSFQTPTTTLTLATLAPLPGPRVCQDRRAGQGAPGSLATSRPVAALARGLLSLARSAPLGLC